MDTSAGTVEIFPCRLTDTQTHAGVDAENKFIKNAHDMVEKRTTCLAGLAF